MTGPKTALLLIGSAKPAGESSSEALGLYLLERLAASGIRTETQYVAHVLRTEARTQAFLEAVAHVDLLILSFPLYVDSLPYLVTAALERIAVHRQAQPAPAPTAFLAIANCGFPEAHHNDTALAICAQFADAAGLRWAGGLALGAGGAVHGQPLAEAGGMLSDVVAALDQTAQALAAGEPVPAQTAARMAQPFVPALAYMLMGDLGWLMEARRHHVLTRLRTRPFRQP
jgi:hypothetical protein